MNAPHIHLMLNHLPVIGLSLGLLVLFIGLLRKNTTVLVVALAITALSGISSYPVMYSGGASEHFLEEREAQYELDHDLIHEHEEAAERAFWPTLITGVVSLIVLFAIWKGYSWSHKVSLGVLVLGIVSMALLYQTANTGGLIRHPELNACCSTDAGSNSCTHEKNLNSKEESCCQGKATESCEMHSDSAKCSHDKPCCKNP